MTDTLQGRSAVENAITEFHYEMRYGDEDKFNGTKPDAFLKVRPNGVAFNEKAKKYVLLLNLPGQSIREMVLRHSLIGTRQQTGL